MNEVTEQVLTNPLAATSVILFVVFIGFVLSRIDQVHRGKRTKIFGGSSRPRDEIK